MTEDEAKKRWCPFSGNRAIRHGPIEYVVVEDGSPFPDLPAPFCIASQCMAFRWQKEDTPDSRPSATDGYCGLAGKP